MDQIRRSRGRWFSYAVLVAVLFEGVGRGQTNSGQAQAKSAPRAATASQSSSPDKIVLKVGDTSLTEGDVESFIQGLTPQAQKSLATHGRRPLGDEFVMVLVLSQEALSHHLDSTPTFKSLLALHRRELLATMEHQEITRQAQVKPEEISSYYTAHQREYSEVMIQDVVVRIRPEGAKEGAPGLTAEEAKARVQEIRKAFISGDDPQKIAEKYRVPNVVRVDTQPYAVRGENLRADMEKAAFELKDGQVSEVYDFGQSLAFFKVVSHKVQDLKTASPQIEDKLRKQKVDSAVDELKKKAKVWIDDSYFAPPSKAGSNGTSRSPGLTVTPASPH